MKKKVSRFIAILALVLAVGAFVWVMQEFFLNGTGEEYQRLRAFYMEDRDSLDVVVIGSSEVKLGYSAPEVYRTTKVTSYPYCFSVNPVPLWTYEMKDIQKRQHPDVLVVEINGAVYQKDKHIHSKGAFYKLADSMPLSPNKIRMASREGDSDLLSCLFPIIRYHGDWTEIGKSDDYKDIMMLDRHGHAILRGTQSPLYQAKIPDKKPYPDDKETAKMNDDAEEALKDFLKDCKSSGIENILFVQFPHLTIYKKSYNRHKRYNRAAEIIADAGYEYVDFSAMKDEIGLDPQTDFYDSEHMNAGGQKKFSDFMGRYIRDKYGLAPSKLSQKQQQQWDESVDYIERYYKFYDEFTRAHADRKYEEVDFNLRESKRVMTMLDDMGPVK